MNEQTLSDLQKRRHTRALQIIKRWRLMDDDFMKRCLKNNIPAVECILRIIMEQPDLHVLSVTIEDTIPSLLGHGIRMDVHAVDSAGTEYDIEVQRSDKGAGARRARFNSSLLDLNSLKKGIPMTSCLKAMSFLLQKMIFSRRDWPVTISIESSKN